MKSGVHIPGEERYELPPLLVSATSQRMEKVIGMAERVVQAEDIILLPAIDNPATMFDYRRRKLELAVNLAEQYLEISRHWQFGRDILEWVRQCEITFESRVDLRSLLRPDVWPHAGRSSFVTLLEEKVVNTGGMAIQKAVGLRLTFRQMPSLGHLSGQFLFYLNQNLAARAYEAWATMNPAPVSALPPERFTFQVVTL